MRATGHSGDQRASEPPAGPACKRPASEAQLLRIWLLGDFRVSVGARPSDLVAWRLRKAQSLLKLLALAPGHRMHKEQVLDLLWPELAPAAAANNLHQALHALRRALALPGETDPVLVQLRNEWLSLGPAGRVWVDVEEFELAVQIARRSTDPQRYRSALALYAGELLPDDRYDDWAVRRRQELAGTYLSLLLDLAGLEEKLGQPASAMEALREVVRVDPTREEAHQHLMRLYAMADQRQAALRQYEDLQRILKAELDTEPDPKTRRIHREIRQGTFAPTESATGAAVPMPAHPHNLPGSLTSFVGRAGSLIEVSRLVRDSPLVTLTGIGGSGKTRLALEVAANLLPNYRDGAWLVELAGLSDEAAVYRAACRALDVAEDVGRSPLDSLVDALLDRQLLLVLDNCEHVLSSAATLAERVVEACPRVRLLATSRQALGVAGEYAWEVPALSLPPAELVDVDELRAHDSVRLFVERSAHHRPGFDLAREAVPVAEICRRVEGLPLAIELAAARVAVLSPAQIAARLEAAPSLLAGPDGVAPARHRSLRSVLAWSHDSLEPAEQQLFAMLSVFSGGWTLEGAEAVAPEPDAVVDALASLVARSLVTTSAAADSSVRFRLLEPVRQYAGEQLEARGQLDAARQRHAEYFLGFAEEAEPQLRESQAAVWLERLDAEYVNLHAALSWALQRRPELALRLATALGRYWYQHGPTVEGRDLLLRAMERVAESDLPVDELLRARAAYAAGVLVSTAGDLPGSVPLLEEGLARFRALDLPERVASALNSLAITLAFTGQRSRAVALLEESLALRRQLGDQRDVAISLGNLAMLEWLSGGELVRIDSMLTEVLALQREAGDEWATALALANLGGVVWDQGDYERARSLYVEAIVACQRIGDVGALAGALAGLAGTVAALGAPLQAARIWGAVERIREEAGVPLPPEEAGLYDRMLAAARGGVSERAWARAWKAGATLTVDQVQDYALELGRAGAPEPDAPARPRLTARQQQVAALVAQGLTNAQAARRLGVSPRTVDNHVAGALRALGLRSRAQLAVWATEELQSS